MVKNSSRLSFYSCLVLFAAISLAGCARVPMSVDTMTYQKYEKIFDRQKEIDKHPLMGVWKVNFASNEKIENPTTAYASVGETFFIAIRRGNHIDFVCTSALRNFGSMSDQGPTHSVNFNGNTFWSFNYTENNGFYDGYITGMLGSEGKAEALLSNSKTSLIIYEYPLPGDGSTEETARIATTTMIIGGPLTSSVPKETVASIFLEKVK